MRVNTAGVSKISARLSELEEKFAKVEPRVHAYLPEPKRFERLAHEAEKLHTRNAVEQLPLFGINLGVKDIFHVDGFPTRAGSRLPAATLRGKEATSVAQMKQAGALIVGKTVTTEFAYFTPGLTRNPRNHEHTPGGSSSGSAAAVAAGLADLALGTQTIGSIIRPASFCGVVGFKPSYGRVSTEGVIPLSPSLDHVGLFARDVPTIQRGAAVICIGWKTNRTIQSQPTLALPTGEYLLHASPEMLAHFEKSVENLREAGFQVKQLVAMPEFAEVVKRNYTILAAEAAIAHADWYGNYRHLYSVKMAELIENGKKISETQRLTAVNEARNFCRNLSTLMDIHGIDLCVSPAAVGAAPKGLASTGDPVMNLPWTQAGLPTMGLPSGKNAAGLPLGVQFTADFNRDEDLLAWGVEIERVLAEAA